MTTATLDLGVDLAGWVARLASGSFATLTPTTDPITVGGAS